MATSSPSGLLTQLVPSSPAYNIVDVFAIAGGFHVDAFRRAFAELASRHEILRASFGHPDGQLMQRVAAPWEPVLPEVDLTSVPDAERAAAWTRMVDEQARAPFDLARAPLFRAAVAHWSPTEHRVLLVLHHILADEWSMEIIHKEMRVLYDAFSRGRTPSLQPLPIQYADYALWQRDMLRGDESLEVASMMRRAGQRVDIVALLDTLSPQATRRNAGQWLIRCIRQLVTREGRAKARRRLSRIWRRLVPRPSTGDEGGRVAEDAYVKKQEAFYDAITKWTADALLADMDVVLFRAADQKFAPGRDGGRDYGWHWYLGKPIEVVDVPGDHLGMLRDPNVAELGKRVKQRLARAAAKQEREPETQAR